MPDIERRQNKHNHIIATKRRKSFHKSSKSSLKYINIVIYLQQKKTGQQKLHFSSLTIFVCNFFGYDLSLLQSYTRPPCTIAPLSHVCEVLAVCDDWQRALNILHRCTWAPSQKANIFGKLCGLVLWEQKNKNFDEETKKHQQQGFTCTNITIISVKHHVGVKKPAKTWTGWMHGICLQAWYLSHP